MSKETKIDSVNSHKPTYLRIMNYTMCMYINTCVYLSVQNISIVTLITPKLVEQQSKIIDKTRTLSEVYLKSMECDLPYMYLHLYT